MDHHLLQSLCSVQSPSGFEALMKEFVLEYVKQHSSSWHTAPTVIEGDGFQDCVILIFGNPKLAAFAHMDTTGFMVRYQNQLSPIGSPDVNSGDILQGQDAYGEIICKTELTEEGYLFYKFGRAIQTGTSLVYKEEYSEKGGFIYSPYLDNRVGVYNLLKLAETLENGALVFSCYEENGGGSVPYLIRYLVEHHHITKALISDVTWITQGVQHNQGVVVSLKDHNIPRNSFIQSIRDIANKHGINHQLEVESEGSSDGRELQLSPYPVDWCFVGPPEDKTHSAKEKIHANDIEETLRFYQVLFRDL